MHVSRRLALAALFTSVLAACGGGGDGGSATTGTGGAPLGGGDATGDSGSVANPPAAGQAWAPHLDPKMWHWIASDRYARVLLAAENLGQLWRSTDAGASWSAVEAPSANWVSASAYNYRTASDMNGAATVYQLAAAYGGGLYESTGGAFEPVNPVTRGVTFTNREWESVAANSLGTALAAPLNGPIYVRADRRLGASTPWVSGLGPGNRPVVAGWRGVAISDGVSTGEVAVAVSEDGQVWVSENSGRNWTRRDIVVDGGRMGDAWYRVAISRDASVIAVAGRFNTNLFLSRDRGRTWTRTNAPFGDYTSISISDDGSTIVATHTNGASSVGSVQISRDRGQTFTAMTMPGTDTNWRASAIAGDAHLIAVAAGTFTSTVGQLYTLEVR